MDRRGFMTTSAGAVAGALCGDIVRAEPVARGEVGNEVELVRRALALHPGLHRYLTPGQVDLGLSRLAREWEASRSRADHFLALQRFLSTIRCGHTHCNFYNQSDVVVAELFNRPTRLPFAFAWIGERMIVLPSAFPDAALPPGSEVVAVNGQPARDLLAALMPYARADGHNDAKRRVQLEMRNTEKYEYFDIFQGLLRPPPGGMHRLDVRTPDGRRARLERSALGLKARQAAMRVIDTDGATRPFWQWEMRDGVALLTMPDWTTYNSKWDWQGWLDERLASLGGAKGLVIDLRDNEGGTECGNVILSRLASTDLRFPGYRELVRFRRTPPDLDKYLDTWDRSFRTLGVDAKDIGGGFYQLPGEGEASDFIPATGPRLTVRVAALVSPVCSSATFSFARRARESGLVRLFGETTGGNLRGINGSAYFFVRLPHSGIEFDVPLIGYFPRGKRPDAGVEPDVRVERTAADIASGRDRCLETALAWARA